MIEDIDLKEEDEEEEYFINNYSFDENNKNLKYDLYLFSKENIGNKNEYFESEFKKVFNERDAFGQLKLEDEKEIYKIQIETKLLGKKKKFKCDNNRVKKFLNIKSDFKYKNLYSILKKNNIKYYSFDEIIKYLKKINKASNSNISILNKYYFLKIESKLISELKSRILYNLQHED